VNPSHPDVTALRAALVEHARDLILVVDEASRIRYASPSAQALLGVDAEALSGRVGTALLHPDDMDVARLALARLVQHPASAETFTCRVRGEAGQWRWMEACGSNALAVPTIGGLVFTLRDITAKRELEGRLEWQAFHDPLTGLANRVLFTDRVSHALSRRSRAPIDVGVLFIDLDHLKKVNDSLGHAAGDALLREAARRIQQSVRAADTVARLGGDEFAVLLEDSSAAECLETAERLLTQLTRPFVIEAREVVCGASIGVALADAGANVDDVVRDADVAMYVAKAEGRGRVVQFAPAMRAEVAERLLLGADLRRAIAEETLAVHYQPQFDLARGVVTGAEALLRWMHPTRGEIAPSRFVPIAEQAGLMSELGRFVLRTACRDAAAWRGACPLPLGLSVNIGTRHLHETGVVADITGALSAAGLPATLLTIELTESALLQGATPAVGVLRALDAYGVGIAIDDFGTGVSSLANLRTLPVRRLKIDRRFVTALGQPGADDALARAIIALGGALGLTTVAEGIETSAQLAELRALGCPTGQGYLLAHPLPAAQFIAAVQDGALQRHGSALVGALTAAAAA